MMDTFWLFATEFSLFGIKSFFCNNNNFIKKQRNTLNIHTACITFKWIFFLTSIKHGFLSNSRRKQLTFHKPSNGFPTIWRLMNEQRNSIQSSLEYPDFLIFRTCFSGPMFFGNITEIKIHVYGKRQTADSSWDFLRIENKQIKTVQKNSYL